MTLPVTSAIAARAETTSLDAAAIERNSRHLLLPEVGMAGQRRLAAARVLVIGTGGLGSPCTMYLAAAGLGTLGLVEFDRVDASNLQRQILYRAGDVGRLKLDAAAERLQELAPATHLELHHERLDGSNVLALLERYDIVIDGTDNFATRYLVQDACVLLGKPLVYGSIFRFDGQLSVFYPPHGPCYRCLFPDPPLPGQVPNCAEGGVLGVLPGLVGVAQATEAIKLIIGRGEPLLGRLLTYDALGMRFQEFKMARDASCPACGDQPSITSPVLSAESCGLSSSAAAVAEISPRELERLRQEGRDHLLIDVRTPEEAAICHIAGSILVPLATLPDSLDRLPKDRDIIVYCKSGVRSAKAARFLSDAAYGRVRSLSGGILEWIASMEPQLTRY